MKKIALIFLLAITNVNAKTLIVSDVDDTIKVTNVLNPTMKILNGIFAKKAFSGMSELYRQMNSADTVVYYVSGSPNIVRSRITSFLNYNNYPQVGNLILKNGKISTYDYKVKEIRTLIAKLNPDKIILLGDDTEFDPEVYNTLSKENGDKIEGIYIRAIKNRTLPENELIKNFFSPVEVAGLELLKGNFAVSGLDKVATSFIGQDHNSQVVINHRYCPAEGRTQIDELKQKVSDQSAINSLEKTQEKIISICRK
jgi:phosphatidate phosphatase APP1